MSEQYTTYTVKSRNSDNVWVFKYELNGYLKSFKMLDGILDDRQVAWLFQKGNFPYIETIVQSWMKGAMRLHFDISIGQPDTSFDAFWNAYGNKVHKIQAQKEWKKIKEADRIKALDGIRRYNNHLRQNTWKNKMDAQRYLKEKGWEDEY